MSETDKKIMILLNQAAILNKSLQLLHAEELQQKAAPFV